MVGGADAENDELEKGERWENGEEDMGSRSGYTRERKGS